MGCSERERTFPSGSRNQATSQATFREAAGSGSRYAMAAGLGQSAHCVHRRCPKPNYQVTSTDQGESLLLLAGPVSNRPQNLWIQPGVTGQLLGIHLITLAIAV